ncbi:hypothetical protein COCNU_03G010850 [Cocos nucifera]|uniref:FAE domain-containing protein n=1 Tax=Cocos nucifera TaxID=13894 RepID=A0A8K0I3P9_COCNU|nr:hypothetical protein COCNU_03G010850 [Cocos nucifera]
MLIPNYLFRVGSAAVLLSNRSADRRHSKYRLVHIVRTHTGPATRPFSASTRSKRTTTRSMSCSPGISWPLLEGHSGPTSPCSAFWCSPPTSRSELLLTSPSMVMTSPRSGILRSPPTLASLLTAPRTLVGGSETHDTEVACRRIRSPPTLTASLTAPRSSIWKLQLLSETKLTGLSCSHLNIITDGPARALSS